MICIYCGGSKWRTNLRDQVECVGCSAPQSQLTLAEIAVERAAVGYPVVHVMAEALFADKMDELNERVYQLKLEIGNALLPVLVPAVDAIVDRIYD